MTPSEPPFDSFFLPSLSPDEQRILNAAEGVWMRRTFSKGEAIFKETDVNRDLYFIVKGEVEITKRVHSKERPERLLATLSAGGVFGEGALLSGRPRSATVRTLVDTELLVLTEDQFRHLIERKPSLAISLILALLRIVNQRLISTNQELIVLYEISQHLRDFPDDLGRLATEVGQRLALLTGSFAGLISLEHEVNQQQQVLMSWGGCVLSVNELEALERELGGAGERVVGKRLIVPLRNYGGQFWGLIVMDHAESWTYEQRKLVRSVAEPLALAFEDAYWEKTEANRSKLNRKNIQF